MAAEPNESALTLSFDLWSAKVLVWTATLGRNAQLTPEAHLFFFDRYSRLAEHHRKLGHRAKARRLQERADEHYIAGGDDGPHAAAMAMPRPKRFFSVNAVDRRASTHRPDDAA